MTRENYTVKVKKSGKYKEVFNSDEFRFGGKGVVNSKSIHTAQYEEQSGKKQNFININLPANSAVIICEDSGKARRV